MGELFFCLNLLVFNPLPTRTLTLIQKTTTSGTPSSWRGDLIGGCVGALIAVPTVLSCGSVFFAGIGPGLVAAGIASAFISAVLCAIVAGCFGGETLHVNCPKTSHAAILAGLCAIMAGQPGFVAAFPGAATAPALMLVCFLTILLSGVVQFGLGALQLGAAVKFVPLPVLAGFVNGFALQIILGQFPKLFGVNKLNQVWQSLLHNELLLWPLGLSILTVVLTQISGRFLKNVPSPLVGLIGGTVAWQAAAHTVDPTRLGPLIGALPENLLPIPHIIEMVHFIATPGFLGIVFPIAATAITLAMVSSIQSLLSIATVDQLAGTQHNSNTELMVQGGGNMLAAIFGGVPSGGSPNISQTVYKNGGRTRLANLAHAGALAVLAIGLGKAIAQVPMAVMAAVVIATTAGSFDKWTQQLISRMRDSHSANRSDIAINLAVIFLVTALVISAGALAALGAGMSLAFMIFLYRTSEHSVRRVLRADALRSRTTRTIRVNDALDREGRRIALVELDGALFFGSIEAVLKRVDVEMATADWLVVDFRRVSLLDSSGALGLKRLDDSLKKQKKRLLFAHLPADSQHLAFMKSVGAGQPQKEGRVFPDTDTALHCAEEELLLRLGVASDANTEMALTDFEVLQGLSASELEVLKGHMTRMEFQAEDAIIRRGEAGRSLFLLTRGRVSVRIGGGGTTGATRLYCHEAGIVLGEMALLSGQPRSADVLADTGATAYELTVDAFNLLSKTSPEIAITLLRNLSIGLADRLRTQTEIIRQLEA